MKGIRFAGNTMLQYGEYLARRTQVAARPSIFWIDTVSACNLRCPFCPTTYAPKNVKGAMKLDLFKSIVDQISEFTLESYLFQTGEPLLNKHIAEMVEYMTLKGMSSIMHTNGTLWTREKAERLFDAGLSFISFSFDGYDAQTYEKSRIRGHFEDTIERIRAVLEVKKRRGLARPYVRIQSLVPPEKSERFSDERRREFMDRFRGLPVDEFDREVISNLAHDMPAGEIFRPGKPMTPEEHRANGYRFKPCTRLWSSMTIRYDGKVVPCCADFETQIPLGDATKDPILKIWNDKPIRALRAKHVQDDLEGYPLCASCDVPYGLDVAGVPVGIPGQQSLFRHYWGPEIHRMLFRPLRFHGGRVTRRRETNPT